MFKVRTNPNQTNQLNTQHVQKKHTYQLNKVEKGPKRNPSKVGDQG